MLFRSKLEKDTYGVYPYDHTYVHGIGVDWGRASYYDKVNGELHNVFRRYGINGWDFEIMDRVAYSDLPYVEREKEYTSTLSFNQESSCIGECEVFAYVLYNHIGGQMNIQLNDTKFVVDTKRDFEVYRWSKLGDIDIKESNLEVSITNSKGFSSLGGILILPKSLMSQLQERISNINVINVSETGSLSSKEINVYYDSCTFTNRAYDNGKITATTDCNNLSDLYLTNFHYDTIMNSEGNEVEIYLNSDKNIYLIFLFVLTFVLTLPITIFLTFSKKRFF